MNIKTFILGVITGAVALAVIDKVVDRQRGQAALESAPAQRAGSSGEVTQNGGPEEAPQRTDGVEGTPPLSPSQIGEAADSELDDSSQGRADAGATSTQAKNPQDAPGGTNERTSADADDPDATLDDATHRGSHDPAEAKDPDWAYHTEQTLQQFLAKHPSAPQFDVLAIDCRTTYCDIRAAASSEAAWPVWQQVVYDITQQPWSEFGQTGSSSNPTEGGIGLVATLHRRPRD